ncbi:MAG: hypothetical protein ACLR5H_05440 [Oscillospiraceae bacterium]
MAKAHYLEKALCALPGVEPVYGGGVFPRVCPEMPAARSCWRPWTAGESWAACLWARTGSCGAPRRRSAARSWTKPYPSSRRCWTDEADF